MGILTQDCHPHHQRDSVVVSCEGGRVCVGPVRRFSDVTRDIGDSWRESGARDGAEHKSLPVLTDVTQQFSLQNCGNRSTKVQIYNNNTPSGTDGLRKLKRQKQNLMIFKFNSFTPW